MHPSTHTKIYGSGIKCLLKQSDISGTYENGVLRIQIEADQMLVIFATEDKILHFFLESCKPHTKAPL